MSSCLIGPSLRKRTNHLVNQGAVLGPSVCLCATHTLAGDTLEEKERDEESQCWVCTVLYRVIETAAVQS